MTTRIHAGPSEFWRALHDTERLARHAIIYTWAAALIPPGWVLDLGCECGLGSQLIAETNPRLRVLGMDLDLPALRYFQNIPSNDEIPRVNASAFRLPIACESIGGIYLINLLHMVNEPADILSEAWRALKCGGIAIISVPPEDDLENRPSSSRPSERLRSEIEDRFAEVIYPDEIHGRIPSFASQRFPLDQAASPWIAFCQKT
jgi:SAM-dependent methyltransferase